MEHKQNIPSMLTMSESAKFVKKLPSAEFISTKDGKLKCTNCERTFERNCEFYHSCAFYLELNESEKGCEHNNN